MPQDPSEITTINIASNMRKRSKDAELSYEHPGHFQEYVFNHKIPKFAWEVYEVLLEGHKHPEGEAGTFLCLAPRDHTKTTIGEAFALWKVGPNPLELVQCICSVMSLARQRLRKIESCIRFNPRFYELYGNLYPGEDPDYIWNRDAMEVVRDRKTAWETGQVERDPTFAAFGMETSVEGGRAGLQFFDDIVTVANSSSEVQRDATSLKFWMSFDPMLLPSGQQYIVGTRYGYEDLYAELIPKFDTDRLYTALYGDDDDWQNQ